MKIVVSIFLFSCLALMAGCGQETESSLPVEAEVLPTINRGNAKAFLKQLANDYLTLANSLEAQSNFYQQNNDPQGFVVFRNNEWTPKYLARKLFYEKSLEKNQIYISENNLEKPFSVFSSLIYIGLDIKHGLQNNDQNILIKAHKLLAKNQRYMEKIKEL